MKVVILGTGNVAYHLANALRKSEECEVVVYGRNAQALETFRQQLSDVAVVQNIPPDADVYLIAVNDDSINEVSQQIPTSGALVAHTSGSRSIDDIQSHIRRGVFYPLQTFSRDISLDYSQIPLFIDAATTEDRQLLQGLAEIFTENISIADDEQRRYLHITAVFVCNFVNHLLARGKEISDANQVPFEYFHPLIRQTLDKALQHPPKDVQTGPARRGDTIVTNTHLQMLTGWHLTIYQTLTNSISDMYEL